MSQNQQPSKSRWGVGAFLQQAVAGVESGLDRILAEEDDLPLKPTHVKTKSVDGIGNQAGTSAQKLAASCMMLPYVFLEACG